MAEFELKLSHGDPIRDQNYGFGTYDMCWNMYIYRKKTYYVLYIYGIYIYIFIYIIYIYIYEAGSFRHMIRGL